MRLLSLIFAPRHLVLLLSFVLFLWVLFAMALHPDYLLFLAIPLVVFGGLTAVGTNDLVQKRHSVLRNYPIMAHLRFLLEHIRPEMRQYFFESETDGAPFSRDRRALVYQRAKMPRQAALRHAIARSTDGLRVDDSIRWRRVESRQRAISALRSAARLARSRIPPACSISRR